MRWVVLLLVTALVVMATVAFIADAMTEAGLRSAIEQSNIKSAALADVAMY